MTSRLILRLSLVLALFFGLIHTLLSRPMPNIPFAAWFFLSWLLDALLAFVLVWVFLSLIGWAVSRKV